MLKKYTQSLLIAMLVSGIGIGNSASVLASEEWGKVAIEFGSAELESAIYWWYYERLSTKEKIIQQEGGEKFVKKIDAMFPRFSQTQVAKLDRQIHSLNIKAMERLEDDTALRVEYIARETRKQIQEHAKKYNISQTERKAVEQNILEIQKNIIESIDTQIETVLQNIIAQEDVRETGDFGLNFLYNDAYSGEMSIDLELNDYLVETKDIQTSRFQGSVVFSFDAGFEKVNGEMEVDLIQKNNTLFVKIWEIRLEGDRAEEWQDIIKLLNTLASERNYIEIPLWGEELSLGTLNTIFEYKNEEWYKTITTQALLTPYGKVGDEYFLTGTPTLCAILMQTDKCTNLELNMFISSIFEMVDMRYSEKNATQKVMLYSLDEDTLSFLSNAELHFQNKEFQKVNMYMVGNDYTEEMHMDYEHKKHLKMHISSNHESDWRTEDFMMHTELYFWDGYLSSVDFNMTMNEENEYYSTSTQANMTLKDKKMNGEFTMMYDGEEEGKCSLSWTHEKNYTQAHVDCLVENEATLKGSLNYDTRNNKNNIDIKIDVEEIQGEWVMQIHVYNTGRKQFIRVNIPNPSKTLNYEELLEQIEDMLYENID